MDERRCTIATQRRLSVAAAAYVTILRPEAFTDSFLEPEYAMSPRQAHDMLRSSFERNCTAEIGRYAALRVLRGATNSFLLTRYGLRLFLAVSTATLILVHGVNTGVLLQTVLYLSTRPISWMNRSRGARVAESIMRSGRGPDLAPRTRRRALRRSLDSIPASALTSRTWRDDLVRLLPRDEATREIALKLADQYDGDIASLVATSRALAR